MNVALKDLQDRNDVLKSKLLHDQLNWGDYPFHSFKREMSLILKEYFNHKSLFKSASIVGISPKIAFKWYIQGQMGNPQFRIFYLRINYINNRKPIENGELPMEELPQELDGAYEVSNYGDGWSYTTYVDGEKIFIISNDLDSLKKKVEANNLPIN